MHHSAKLFLPRLLALFFALWLPFANAWALLAPCAHGAPSSDPIELDHAMPCHDTAAPAAVDVDAHASACVNCAHCHPSGTPLLAAAPIVHEVPAHAVEHAHRAPARISYIPDLLLPPPVA